MENAVEKAIRILGPSMWEASMRTKIHPTTLYKWAKAGRIKDGRRAVEVSRLTEGQVTIEELVGATPNGQPNGGKRAASSKTSTRSRALAKASKAKPSLPAIPATLAAA